MTRTSLMVTEGSCPRGQMFRVRLQSVTKRIYDAFAEFGILTAWRKRH